MSIEIEVIPPSPGRIRSVFNRILEIVGLRRPRLEYLRDVSRAFTNEIRKGFDSGTDPYGERWRPSLANKLCGQKTLIRTKRLRATTGARPVGSRIQLRATAPYAKTHQNGAIIRAKNKPYLKFKVCGRWFTKKEVRIPQRLILPVSGKGLPRKWEQIMQAILDRRAARADRAL